MTTDLPGSSMVSRTSSRLTTSGPVTAPQAAATTPAHAAGLPVTIGPAGSLDGKVLPPTAAVRAARTANTAAATPQAVHAAVASHAVAQRAGVDGLLVSLSRTDASGRAERVSVAVDYSQIKDAFGAGYGERLRLTAYPGCILTTPQVASCRTGTPVPASANDTAHQQLVGDVALPPTAAPADLPDAAGTAPASGKAAAASAVVVLAATPDASGSSGSFAATPLSSSAKWGASGSTGAFTYSYPIAVPPALGGAAPNLALTYNSQDADGRTSQTNNQGSWAGDGWTLWSGSVTRSYRTCADDGEASTDQEQCWAGDNASITLNGASHELVPVSAPDANGLVANWRFADDDGSTVQEVQHADNGVIFGTYWQVTDRTGTVFLFGADHLPAAQGGTGTDASTQSAWGAPVYGNDAGEPCHASTLDASYCTTGWQWNLDFTIDPHQNITVYNYAAETNYYGRGTAHTPKAYTRGGSLTSITYGQHVSDYTAGHNPAAKVNFALAPDGRCDPTGFTCAGATLSTANAGHWPDVPFDQNCGSASCSNYAPSFWTNDRLITISTQVWDSGLSTPGYRPVDTYALSNADFPDPGDGTTGVNNSATPKAMWLANIVHTGNDTGGGGAAVTENPVKFGGAFYANRVPGLIQPAVTPLTRRRMTVIVTQTGASIAVSYKNDSCSRTSPPSEDNDHTTCYPVRWTPTGYAAPILDWFNKYLVGEVDVSDNSTTKSPPQVTTYDYLQNGAAWHHDDDEIIAAKYRTWDQWRGYSQVTTHTGATPDPITESTTSYLQGMDGDLNADGTHKSVSVTPARGAAIVDRDAWSGDAYQTVTYDHDGGDPRSRVVTVPWISPATASHTRAGGLPEQDAYYTDTAATYTMTWISGSTWRTAGTFSTFDDATGLVKTDDDRGEIDSSDQPVTGGTTPEKCTRTTYATTPSGGATGLPAEVVDVTGGCGSAVDAAHTVSDVRTYYDHSATLGQVPAAGDATGVKALKNFLGTGGAAQWTALTDTVYDSYGRITSATDAMKRTSSTAYLPANSIALPTLITVTNPLGWQSSTTIDVARGIARSEFDPNNKVATQTSDGLGRLTQSWSAQHPKSANASTPNVQYTYNVSATGPSWVETQTLREALTYQPDYKIYDSLLQLREEQTTTADDTAGARLISATFYDSLGRTVAADASFFNAGAAPSSTFVLPVDAQVPSEMLTAYDGMGRVTTATQEYNSVPQSTTTTAYPAGNETDVTPPTGGTPTATITDARGQNTEVRQFHAATPAGAYDATHYAYDAAGRQTALTDSSANTWTRSYDQLGDAVRTTDPDTGTTLTAYDDDKEVAETTDALHAPSGGITTSYDDLGRVTNTYAIPAAGGTSVHLTQTDYDPSGALGQVADTISYDSAGRKWTQAVTGYTADYLPTGSTTTIPAGAVGNSAAIAYTTGATYTPVTRNPDTTSLPAAGPMAAENIGHSYDDNGLTLSVGGKDTYLAAMEYTHLGQPLRAHMGVTPTQIDETYNWEASTGRLLNDALDMQTGATPVDSTSYTYNPAGQTTSISDVQDAGGTAKTDTQCFTYDYLQRITQAWTDTGGTTTAPLPSIQGQGGCNHTTPTTANLGGPDPYWQAFGYDATGNRVTATDHSPTGGTSQDTTTTEAYPTTSGAAHPHAVTTATTTGNGGGKQTFSYDAVGNTTEIKQDSGNKVLASGATLASGASMVSDSVRLTMQTDGNLVMYSLKSGQALWASNTAGHPGAVATMGTDGNLTVHTATGTVLWSTGTSAAGSFAQLQDDGQLIVFNTSSVSQWKTPTFTASRAADDITFAYDDNGRLVTSTQPGTSGTATTTYHYDAAGTLLARTDVDTGTSTTTLFLGDDQLTLDSTGTPTADTRYYDIDGAPTAVRTATTGSSATPLHFEASDPNGTATTDITADNTTVTRRAYTPFGQDRTTGGNPATWPGDQGYVGGTPDPTTGLTNLGAREYDPTLGRFLSVDPQLDITDTQSLNGYAYADNTPIDGSDPTGLGLECGAGTGDDSSCGTAVTHADGSTCHSQCDGDPRQGLVEDPNNNNSDNGSDSGSSTNTGSSHKHSGGGSSLVPGFVRHAVQATVNGAGRVGKTAYHLSGASDVVGCLTGPTVGGCAAAGFTVLAVVGTGGEAELEIVAAREADTIAEKTAAEDAAKILCKNSFAPDTPVLLGNGKTKPISKIQQGDKVESADPETGRNAGSRTVTATIVNHDNNLTDVMVKTTSGHLSILHTTTEHPFWDDTTHTWVPAAHLTPGHALETASNTHVYVKAVHTIPGAANRYNLTVNQLHTYYVLAGDTPVLVHNSNGLCGVTSAIHDDPYLVKAAEAAGKNQRIQKEMDELVVQFRGGNTNPGLGNKSLAGTDISYLRGRNGGRVFFRNTDSGMQIVGKADKSNESKVISRLMDMYGN
ncbi:polymorphic toxin-type HINT domain-containing protein [Streptomyces polygonati]|uniref:Polymorphic toxin-type HINT domain-containing protein n=1 Tax=Streptomyces polygonati TaxID=1617087 RepID=A0ABV8HQC9_9ACTN